MLDVQPVLVPDLDMARRFAATGVEDRRTEERRDERARHRELAQLLEDHHGVGPREAVDEQ